MPSYSPDENPPYTFRPATTRRLFPYESSNPGIPIPSMPSGAYPPISTSTSLGRMPLAPTFSVPMEAEVASRADFVHMMLRAALGANYLAPISHPTYILDIGSGSGRWVREMVTEFPTARAVGVDIALGEGNAAVSGTFAQSNPQQSNYQPRYAFVQQNVLEPLNFTPATFDFTHMRSMVNVLPVAALPRVVSEMARLTAPGGWVELVEGDLIRNGGPALETLQRWDLQALAPQGIDPRVGGRMGELLQMAALTEIQGQRIDLPVGPHGGRFGELMAADLMARVEGQRARVVGARIVTSEQFTQAQAALRQEVERMEYVQTFYIVYGRR